MKVRASYLVTALLACGMSQAQAPTSLDFFLKRRRNKFLGLLLMEV